MVSRGSLRSLVGRISRRGWVNLALLLVLVVAVGVSFVTDPSPLVAFVLGVALLGFIVLRSLLAMGVRVGRER